MANNASSQRKADLYGIFEANYAFQARSASANAALENFCGGNPTGEYRLDLANPTDRTVALASPNRILRLLADSE